MEIAGWTATVFVIGAWDSQIRHLYGLRFTSQTDKAEAALNQMLYPRKMATRNEEEKKVVNRRLRRKMLERWENEGGKVGDIGPSPASTGSKNPAGVGKKRSSDTSTKIKK
jgi:hypothetical protein